jgi:hypothetical protein
MAWTLAQADEADPIADRSWKGTLTRLRDLDPGE